MFYYSYDIKTKELSKKDKKGKIVKKVKKLPDKFTEEEVIGIICDNLSKGISLKYLCSKSWASSMTDFFVKIRHNELYKEMYIDATEIRRNILNEEIMQERIEAGPEYSDKRNSALQKALDNLDKDSGRAVFKDDRLDESHQR